jgi:hypothetical protein
MIIREYCKQPHANKLDNLNEINIVLKDTN